MVCITLPSSCYKFSFFIISTNMSRSMHEPAAEHRAHWACSHNSHFLHHIACTLTSKPSHYGSQSYACLHHALLLCRKTVNYFLPFVVLVFLFGCLVLKLLASYSSPLLFSLNYIQAFLLHKLRDALTFVVVTFTIGLLGFLSNNSDLLIRWGTSTGEDRPAASMHAFRRRKREGKKAEFTIKSFPCRGDDFKEANTPDLTGRVSSTWLVESFDECSVEDQGPKCTIWESLKDEDDQVLENDGGLSVQPQAVASALYARQEEDTACINDIVECSSEVRRLQAEANSHNSLHNMRSRSYSFNLSLPDNVASEAEPSMCMGHRSASFSCDGGSSNTQPWMHEDTHADLHSPPLPPFAFDMLEKGSSSFAFALQRELAPWRAPHKSFDTEEAAEGLKKAHDRVRLYGDQALKGRSTYIRRRRKDIELQERSDAFIAQQLQQWKLERHQKITDHNRRES